MLHFNNKDQYTQFASNLNKWVDKAIKKHQEESKQTKPMLNIKCNLTGKSYQVKKVCFITELPKNARLIDTVYFETTPNFPYSGVQDIYCNNSNYYATTVRNLKRSID